MNSHRRKNDLDLILHRGKCAACFGEVGRGRVFRERGRDLLEWRRERTGFEGEIRSVEQPSTVRGPGE